MENISFSTFQSSCRYSALAYAYAHRDDHTRLELVCRKKDRIPKGCSWGICDEEHCPYFGIQIAGEGVLYDKNGSELMKFENMKARIVLPPEDYDMDCLTVSVKSK